MTRLCTLMLAEALLTKTPAVRLQVSREDRGDIEYDRGDRWETVMQVPRTAFEPLAAPVFEMARVPGNSGNTGEIHGGIRRPTGSYRSAFENEVEPRVMITGFVECYLTRAWTGRARRGAEI